MINLKHGPIQLTKLYFLGRAEWRDTVEKGCRESDTESGKAVQVQPVS